MSSISNVASVSGISSLMQTLSNAGTPAFSSLLSSAPMQTALAKASPADIVQLSDEAMQLQMADGLFGGSDGLSQATDSPLNNLFNSFDSPSSSNAMTQTDASNLAMQNVLAASYSVPGISAPSSDTGAYINLLA